VQRLEAAGVITGYAPQVDLAAAGHPVLAFVSLEIAQGGPEDSSAELARVPEVLEAYGTAGSASALVRGARPCSVTKH
jgi:DNA-binding Lrp family transcriptional regulator